MRLTDKQPAGTDELEDPEGAGMGGQGEKHEITRGPQLSLVGGYQCPPRARVFKHSSPVGGIIFQGCEASPLPDFNPGTSHSCPCLTQHAGLYPPWKSRQTILHSCQTLATAMRSHLSVSHTVGLYRKERGEEWDLGGGLLAT